MSADRHDSVRQPLHRLMAARPEDRADCVRALRLLAGDGDPWDRRTPLHLTASALVVHPASGRVLLRWHERLEAWVQLGGHAEAGEHDPLAIALREAREECGLTDLVPWQAEATPTPLQCVVVPVPANAREPAHRHVDIRYALATGRPHDIVAESPGAPLKWLALEDAFAAVPEDNLQRLLRRVDRQLQTGCTRLEGDGGPRRT